MVGITGSNGKTTVKEMIAGIGSIHGKMSATRANENNKIGVPLTLFSAKIDDEMVVLEMPLQFKKRDNQDKRIKVVELEVVVPQEAQVEQVVKVSLLLNTK